MRIPSRTLIPKGAWREACSSGVEVFGVSDKVDGVVDRNFRDDVQGGNSSTGFGASQFRRLSSVEAIPGLIAVSLPALDGQGWNIAGSGERCRTIARVIRAFSQHCRRALRGTLISVKAVAMALAHWDVLNPMSVRED